MTTIESIAETEKWSCQGIRGEAKKSMQRFELRCDSVLISARDTMRGKGALTKLILVPMLSELTCVFLLPKHNAQK